MIMVSIWGIILLLSAIIKPLEGEYDAGKEGMGIKDRGSSGKT